MRDAHRFSIGVAVLLVAGAVGSPLGAQEPPPLVTDRPDQTESASVVPAGYAQLEAGGTHEVAGGPERVTGVGTALARIGLFGPIELRLGWAGWQRESGDGVESRSGFGGATAGLKVGVHEGQGLVPSVALIGTLLVPVGEPDVRAPGVDPEVRAAVAHDLGSGFSLGYNLGARWLTLGDATGAESMHTEGLYTVALGRGFDRVGVFVEAFGALTLSDETASRHAVDGGVTFALFPNVQLDASVGTGLTSSAPDWFVGLGVSARIPR
jgi:hypothetical protein